MPIVSASDLERLTLPPSGRARTIFAPAELLDAVRIALEDRAVASDGQFRLVAMRYDRLPPARAMIDDAIDRLADAAATAPSDNDANASPIPEISLSWRKAARDLRRRGEPPRPRGFPLAVEALQLALMVDPAPLLLALVVHDEAPAADALAGLARVAEWLAGKTGARVVVVVPESLAASPALDSINFNAIHVRPSPPMIDEGEEGDPKGPRVLVSHLIGQPNPNSRGEMILAERLKRDPGLADLFRFNIRVATVRGASPVVDLAWEAGRVVVEVDGYYYHSDEFSFKNDRKRDYELLISGWVVLRLPHDEVVTDPDLAVDKIRDVVAFRRSLARPSPENPR